MPNDKVFSLVTNTGRGHLRHEKGFNMTKQWEYLYYHPHNPPHERKIIITEGGVEKSFFDDATNYTTTVRPGSMEFNGDIGALKVKVTIFVPLNLPCECWHIEILNTGDKKEVEIKFQQDWFFSFVEGHSNDPILSEMKGNVIYATKCDMVGIFGASGNFEGSTYDYEDVRLDLGETVGLTKATLVSNVTLEAGKTTYFNVINGAHPADDTSDVEEMLACLNHDKAERELVAFRTMWDNLFQNNMCSLPDKNVEYFLNYWLKNQLYLTYRYDRGCIYVGYRDGLQDSWGYLLVDPKKAKERLVQTLSYMMPDGRCPRQYYIHDDEHHDMRDFSDSVIWAADALVGYIKETGDFGILDEKIPYLFGGDELTSVEEHVFRGLDSLYQRRAKNGLIKMRDGDWFDGLGGINKYGDDASSVWNTIATFYAQNVMATLYDRIGDTEKAQLMRSRSAEYKKVVNEVGWDGNWYAYAFFEDGTPVGANENLEGKIYANPQSWAIMSGIYDSEDKLNKMVKSVYRYLQTPFGPLLNYPPYALYGAKCGRVQRQRPGTFGNGAVYNHAAGFKVFADVARGDYEEALDTLKRAMPNHIDNSDMCRTSEPYAIGNVYYGPNNPRYGMNLFTWFTATPAWLIHGGFDQILGVKPGFDGLEIEPHVPDTWDTYQVTKIYRDKKYHITFERSDEKGIWVDGTKIDGNTVITDKKECTVTVKF